MGKKNKKTASTVKKLTLKAKNLTLTTEKKEDFFEKFNISECRVNLSRLTISSMCQFVSHKINFHLSSSFTKAKPFFN